MKEAPTDQESAESQSINSKNRDFWNKEKAVVQELMQNPKITSEAAFAVQEEYEKLKKLPISDAEKAVIFKCFISSFEEAVKRAGKSGIM